MDLSERPASRSDPVARHPWELARFEFFQGVLAGLPAQPRSVLDAGAGDGWFADRLGASLPSATRVVCWDAFYTPALMASLAAEASSRVEFVAARPRETFDVVMLLDVLEHVERDREFLGALVRENMANGGFALISVPAWQGLFTAHDTRLKHFRRYSPAAAEEVIADAGLSIIQRGGLFHSLLLPRSVGRLLELLRSPPPSDEAPPTLEWRGGQLVTCLVRGGLALDAQLSRLAAASGIELPGLSWWALCQKR